MKKNKILALSVALVLSLSACGTSASTQSSSGSAGEGGITEVTVGVVGSNNEQWDTVNELLAEENIQVKLVEFSEYKLHNAALDSGEIDLNAFQHKAYLEKEIADLGYGIAILGDTILAPLSLYSNYITDIEQLKEGDKIAVPSDPTNEGRCFKILESAGVLEVDPANTASLLPDVAAAFVNGAHAVDNGLKLEDAVYTEQVEAGSDNPYINIIACRAGEENNEVYQKVLAAYQSEESAQAILDIYQGAYIPAWN